MSEDLFGFILLLLFAQAVIAAFFCAYLAREKGRDPVEWSILGFLFGLLALLVLGFSPPVESHRRSSLLFDPDVEKKKCPACAEYVKLEALRCRHCGEEFDPEVTQAEIQRCASERTDQPFQGWVRDEDLAEARRLYSEAITGVAGRAKPGVRVKQRVKLRLEPSSSGRIVTRLSIGTHLILVKQEGPRAHVALPQHEAAGWTLCSALQRCSSP